MMRMLLVCLAVTLAATSVEAGVYGLATALPLLMTAQAPADTVMRDREQIKESLANIAAPEQTGQKEWQRYKSPRVAMFSSMLLPGLGQVYNGRRWKAVIFAGLASWFLFNAIDQRKEAIRWEDRQTSLTPGTDEYNFAGQKYTFHRETARDFMWWFGATWLVNVLDAWIDAHLFDVRTVKPVASAMPNGDYRAGVSVRF